MHNRKQVHQGLRLLPSAFNTRSVLSGTEGITGAPTFGRNWSVLRFAGSVNAFPITKQPSGCLATCSTTRRVLVKVRNQVQLWPHHGIAMKSIPEPALLTPFQSQKCRPPVWLPAQSKYVTLTTGILTATSFTCGRVIASQSRFLLPA